MSQPPSSPFDPPPGRLPRRRRRPETDPSIENEPHLRGDQFFQPDPSEQRAEPVAGPNDADELAEHGVWDEPALSPKLAGAAPADAVTFATWWTRRAAETPFTTSWLVVLGIALVAGPLSIALTLLAQMSYGMQVFAVYVTVVGPLIEEVAEVALLMWVVEKRSYLLQSGFQILFCAMAGGLVFATIENVIYLNVYIPDPTPGITLWRWVVCTALHTGCSFLAGVGLALVWRRMRQEMRPPRLTVAYPWIASAVVIHGLYNGSALLFELSRYAF